jgi:8-amino-7-oxononanoate synthase
MAHEPSHSESIQQRLSTLKEQGLTRFLRTLPHSGGKLCWNDRDYLNFSSNDYLHLANDTRVKAGAIAAVEEFGCGATSSCLMSGHLNIHEELEKVLASWVNQDACLVFPSGFQANLGMISSLVDKTGAIFSDALNHASLIDGSRLSRAQINIYNHCDMDHLESLLKDTKVSGRKIIISDSVFSMDGDLAPLKQLSTLAKQYNCLLAIDEAHAIGIYGSGHGLCHELNIHPDVIVGTLTKSIGSGGGFVASSHAIQSLLINTARSFIFSTGLSPACAGAALAALNVIESSHELGKNLLSQAHYLRTQLRDQGIEVPTYNSQIIPIIIGDNSLTVDAMNSLINESILLSAIRPPTVPKGTARLRMSVTLAHEKTDLTHAAQTIAKVLNS